jgi:hypothetical protein
VGPGSVPRADEGGPDVLLRLPRTVDRRMDHPAGAAAAAQDDPVGVAVDAVQRLGVTDHSGTVPLPRRTGKGFEHDGRHR